MPVFWLNIVFVGMLNINDIAIPRESSQHLEGEIQNLRNGEVIIDLDLNHPPLLDVALDFIPSPEFRRHSEPQTSKDFDDELAIISPRRFAEVCTSFSSCDSLFLDLHAYRPIYVLSGEEKFKEKC